MIDSLEILQEAINSGIINVDSVQEQIMTKKHEQILKEHPYSTWEGKDGKWRTYIHDETKPKKRRMVKRTSKEKIEEFIINYYEELEHNDNNKEKMTLRKLYPEWLQYKSLQVNSSTTIARLEVDWKRFYSNDNYNKTIGINIIDTPLKDLTYIDLDSWAHYIVKNGNSFPTFRKYKKKDNDPRLSKKQYFNISIIVRQMLDYAVNKNLIENNQFLKVKIDSKLYRKVQKENDNSQVYLISEEEKLIQMLWDDFQSQNSNMSYLAIVLNFYLGLRVGELIALNKDDIEGRYLHVRRQLVKTFDTENVDNLKFEGYKLVNYTKSVAGDRRIYLVDDAMKILEIVKQTSNRYYSDLPEYNEGFLFLKCGKYHHLIPSNINRILVRSCKKLGIDPKRSHKIRKTVISTLVDSGMNINTIREFAGHEDERTTYNNYTYDRSGEKGVEAALEKTLSRLS